VWVREVYLPYDVLDAGAMRALGDGWRV
jgi:hypothetical protein